MMQNEQDIALFEALARGELGKSLVAYLRRLQDEFCDARKITANESLESVRRLARLIDTAIIDKIEKRTEVNTKVDFNPGR